MPKLSPIPSKKLQKILLHQWFQLLRIHWSHRFFRKWNLTTVVPIHSNEDISVGLLRKILRDIDISVEEFEKMRR